MSAPSMNVPKTPFDISFCIINLNACSYLKNCLHALPAAAAGLSYEVIVVDNGSTDGSRQMLQEEFPATLVIVNSSNLGYTLPMNQALRATRGAFLAQINPDTLPHGEAFNVLYSYMQSHPDVGICTPKVLNIDGTLQRQCRRGAARPWDVISYFLGLSNLFPHSRFFGGYLKTYLKEDELTEVEAVSGSCMLVRRAVIDQIGYLDEQFFAYQEDADFCFRTRQAGWKIMYVPQAAVTHLGGQGGSRTQPMRGIYEWHHSYYLYYNKHLARDYFFLVNWFMYLAMGVKLGLSLLVNAIRKEKVVGTKKPAAKRA